VRRGGSGGLLLVIRAGSGRRGVAAGSCRVLGPK